MQYLEFLAFQLLESNFTTVIYKLIVKNYIITTSSILEMLFAYIIEVNDKLPKRKMNEGVLLEKTKVLQENETYYKVTRLSKVVNKKITRKELKFSTSIDLISKYNFLDINHEDKVVLTKIRKLRNRIHLNEGISHLDHDYNNFSYETYLTCKEVLIKIVLSINKDHDTFELINLIKSKL
jgi:hypothetical protein